LSLLNISSQFCQLSKCLHAIIFELPPSLDDFSQKVTGVIHRSGNGQEEKILQGQGKVRKLYFESRKNCGGTYSFKFRGFGSMVYYPAHV